MSYCLICCPHTKKVSERSRKSEIINDESLRSAMLDKHQSGQIKFMLHSIIAALLNLSVINKLKAKAYLVIFTQSFYCTLGKRENINCLRGSWIFARIANDRGLEAS